LADAASAQRVEQWLQCPLVDALGRRGAAVRVV